MSALDETATLMRIFIDEDERYHKKPLFMAIIDVLCERGFIGATVLKGIEGFGSHDHLHSQRAIDAATSLPVLIEVAETDEKIRDLIPTLRDMICEGLITLERIQMRRLSKNA